MSDLLVDRLNSAERAVGLHDFQDLKASPLFRDGGAESVDQPDALNQATIIADIHRRMWFEARAVS